MRGRHAIGAALVDGRVLVKDFSLLNQDVAGIVAEAKEAARALAARAGV